MVDTIVYNLVTSPGGVDGMDHTDKGGKVVATYLSREKAIKDSKFPWCVIQTEVIDLDELKKQTLASLTPLQRIALFLGN